MKLGSFSVNNNILLAFILLFGLFMRMFFSIGVIDSGDLAHIDYSYKAAKGDFGLKSTDSQTSSRIGFIYPVALSYKILGVSDFSAYLFPLIMSLASIVLVYLIGKELFSEDVGVISAFLLSFFPMNVNYATRVYPDLPMAFFAGLSVYFFLLGEKKEIIWEMSLWYLLSGLSAGLAYLTKESGIIILVFFCIASLYKFLFLKMKLRFAYAWIIIGVALIISLQMAKDLYLSGDFFLRHRQISGEYNRALDNLYNYQGYKLVERLLAHIPYMMLTDANFGFFTVFVLMASAYVMVFRSKEAYIILIWLLSLFIYLDMGSTSLTSYIPLPGGTPRYLEILSIPSILLIAFFISDRKNAFIRKLIMPFTLMFLFITSIGFIYISPDRHLPNIERNIAKFLESQNDLPVYADSGTAELLAFFTGYGKDIRVYWSTNYPEKGSIEFVKPEQMKNAYVIVNRNMLNKVPANYDAILPSIYYEPPKGWILLKKFEEEKGDAFVYSVNQ